MTEGTVLRLMNVFRGLSNRQHVTTPCVVPSAGPDCPLARPQARQAPALGHNAYGARPACRDRKPHRGQTLSAAARSLLQPTTPCYCTPSCAVTQGGRETGRCHDTKCVTTRTQSHARDARTPRCVRASRADCESMAQRRDCHKRPLGGQHGFSML